MRVSKSQGFTRCLLQIAGVLVAGASVQAEISGSQAAAGEAAVRRVVGTRSVIEGTVVDRSAAPIGGATVTLISGARVKGRTTTTTTPAGEFSLDPQAPGRYELVVERALFESSRMNVSVEEGVAQVSLQITLNVAAMLA